MACYACKSHDIFVCYSSVDSKHLIHCLDCGLYFFLERPSSEELTKYYRGMYSEQHQQQLFQLLKDNYNNGFFNGDAQNSIHYLKYVPQKVLDYGCSYGFYLKAMKEITGAEVYGADYDKEVVDYNERDLNITMINPYNLNILPDNSFDIVRSYHTIEHLPNPRKELSEFYRILKNDGILLLSSPCFSEALVQSNVTRLSGQMVYPDHLFYFTKKAMLSLLTDLGFSVEINISQFANPGQALEILGAKGEFDTDIFDSLIKALEAIGAGLNSFVVARKTLVTNNINQDVHNGSNMLIYPLQIESERASHYNMNQNGMWEILFPIKRTTHGKGRLFVSGNIVTLSADNPIEIQLSSTESGEEMSRSDPVQSNQNRSFVFWKDVKGDGLGRDEYRIRITGTNPAEFVLYDLNCSESSKPDVDS